MDYECVAGLRVTFCGDSFAKCVILIVSDDRSSHLA